MARAPGRLDVMGGIADYSGSLVLQWPIREATLVAVQAVSEPGLKLLSLATENGHEARMLELNSSTMRQLLEGDYDAARRWFARDPALHWAAYVLGVLLVLERERGLQLNCGLRILVESKVPEGKGVSSSAALEVATMQAVTGLAVTLEGTELARLCQMAENFVVGAPCGIMDQMTSLGRPTPFCPCCASRPRSSDSFLYPPRSGSGASIRASAMRSRAATTPRCEPGRSWDTV